MKLKYNLIAWSLLGFFAAACDPMDALYNCLLYTSDAADE